ncbi:MAG: hypothetical protein Q9167_007366 [Letrouitia subvulpina]
MGHVRTKTVKRFAKVIIERYYPQLCLDFEVNKRTCDEVAIIASKRLRNKDTRRICRPDSLSQLCNRNRPFTDMTIVPRMKRIQRGPVRGISFKLQEEERERKDQYVPEVSALDFSQNSETGQLDVDVATKELLKSIGVNFSFPVVVSFTCD